MKISKDRSDMVPSFSTNKTPSCRVLNTLNLRYGDFWKTIQQRIAVVES